MRIYIAAAALYQDRKRLKFISDAVREAILRIDPAAAQIIGAVYPTDLKSDSNTESGIAEADMVVADITNAGAPSSAVMYEIGFARSAGKPVLLLADSRTDVPYDIADSRVLVYDAERSPSLLAESLEGWIRETRDDPSWPTHAGAAGPPSAFISYAHADAEYLTRLRVHLRPLEKAGRLDVWVDTRIRVGDLWKGEIDRALTRATVAVLLISADFLASDFIVDNELPPILENAQHRGTRIVPVIVKPCRFARDPNLSRFQAMNDPSLPLAALPQVEQEGLYDKVAEAVEHAVAPTLRPHFR